MSNKKKNFGFDGLLGGLDQGSTEKLKPIKIEKKIGKEIRVTLIVNEDYIDKIKSISFMERKLIKEVWNDAISSYLKNYEQSNGEIPIPKK